MRTTTRAFMLVLLILLRPSTTWAQVFGTFSWQLQPFCNAVTLTLTRSPAGFTVDGTDDLCGAFDKASAVGVASFNGGGYVTLNFTIVTAPLPRGVHVSAVVRPDTGAGTWSDSAGNSGVFVLAGAAQGLPARPVPASGLAPASITAAEIADGAVGINHVNPAQVQARIAGACSARQAIRGVNVDGSVVCENADEGGDYGRSTFDSVALPSGVGGAGVPLSLPNGVVITGPARIHVSARGYCSIESSATSAVAVQVEITPSGVTPFAAVTPEQGLIEVPAEAVPTVHTLAFTADFEAAFGVANSGGVGPPLFIAFALHARHLRGDAANNTVCSGSWIAQLHKR